MTDRFISFKAQDGCSVTKENYIRRCNGLSYITLDTYEKIRKNKPIKANTSVCPVNYVYWDFSKGLNKFKDYENAVFTIDLPFLLQFLFPCGDYSDSFGLKELRRLLKPFRKGCKCKAVLFHSDNMESPVIMAILFGLRRSEVLGLRWSNIDFDNKILKVCETVTRQHNADGKLVDTVSKVMKTDASRGQYSLTDDVAAYLKSKFAEQQEMARETDEYKDYVCINSVGERLHLDYITDKFGKLLKQNGLPHIRFHDLRHSCISLLVNSNISMKAPQMYARHANFTTTADTYSHVENSSSQLSLGVITKALNFKGITSAQEPEDQKSAPVEKKEPDQPSKSFYGLNDKYSLFMDIGAAL